MKEFEKFRLDDDLMRKSAKTPKQKAQPKVQKKGKE